MPTGEASGPRLDIGDNAGNLRSAGAAALVPKAPPVTDILCDPIPPQNAAVVERPMLMATQRTESFFMPNHANGTAGLRRLDYRAARGRL